MSLYTGPAYPYGHDSAASLQPTVLEELRSDNVSLRVRQQPRQALLAAVKKERTRKPVDPPIVVQMEVDRRADPTRLFLHNPNLFAVATLETESGHVVGPPCLLGSTTSSLHRLKEVDSDGTWGNDGGFFVFGDVSVAKMGRYRFHFTVFELRKDEGSVVKLQESRSDIFDVVSPKDYMGLEESSFLTRAFADQGVRLRLRKEQRSMSSGTRPRRDTRSTQEEEDRSFPSLSPLHKRNTSWMTTPDEESPRPLKRSRTGLGSMYPGVPHSTRGWGAFPSADMQAWKTQAEDSSMSTAPSLMSDIDRYSGGPYSQPGYPNVPMGATSLPTVTHTADWRNDSPPRRSHNNASSPVRPNHQRNVSSQLQHSPTRLEHDQSSPDGLKQETMSQADSQSQMNNVYDDASFGYRPRGNYEEEVGLRGDAGPVGRPFALQTLASASEHLPHIPQSDQIGGGVDGNMENAIGGLPLGLSPVIARHAYPVVHNLSAYGHSSLVGQPSVAQQLLHRMNAQPPWMPGGDGNRSPYGTTHA